jgi:two-component system, chemotaxis family, protein-glutamate methylesterase/glutaminase
MPVITNCSCPIRVLMIDESAIVMQLFARELGRHFDLQLVGTARELSEANQKISDLKPDVITLDIEMSRLDAPAFLANVMQSSPRPVIVLASPTDQGAAAAMDALEAGAVGVLFKPDAARSIDHVIVNLLEKIRGTRGVKAIAPAHRSVKTQIPPLPPDVAGENILAIGSSCASIGALDQVLAQLPPNSPGTVIVQNLPARITGLFAQRLNQVCNIAVKEASSGDRVIPGCALIAPGGRHMLLRRSGDDYFVHIKDGPEVFHHKPSVDVLFNSVARAAGRNAIGALLYPTGLDGAQGLLNLRKAGGHTIAANEGNDYPAAERVVALAQIASAMIEMASQPKVFRTAQ